MHQVELQKILEGVIENNQRFGIIFTADEDDDWTSETALLKANPNYGVSIDAEFLRLQQLSLIHIWFIFFGASFGIFLLGR